MDPGFIRFTNLTQELEWKDYFNLFAQFGQITKLYIDPLGEFGSVQFLNIENAFKAQKELNRQPPINLDIERPTRSITSSKNTTANAFKAQKELNGAPPINLDIGRPTRSITSSKNTTALVTSSKMNRRSYNTYNYSGDDDVNVITSEKQYVDVYGRILDTLELEDGSEIYVPISDLKKSGFEIFTYGSLPKHGEIPAFDEQIFRQYEMYLKIKSRKFIINNNLNISDTRANGVIDRLKNEYCDFLQDRQKGSFKGFSPTSASSRGKCSYPRGRPNERKSFGSYEGSRSAHRDSAIDQLRRPYADGNSNGSYGGSSSREYRSNTSGQRSYSQNFNMRNEQPRRSQYAEETVEVSKPVMGASLGKDISQQDEDGTYLVHAEKPTVTNETRVSFAEGQPESIRTPTPTDNKPALRRPRNDEPEEEIKTEATSAPEKKTVEVKQEVKPKEIKPKEVKPKEVKPEEVKAKEVKPEEVKPKEVKPEEVSKPAPVKKTEVARDAKPGPVKIELASDSSLTVMPCRDTVIEKIADSGFFDCTEIVSTDTFVGVAMPATFIEEVSILDDITNDCIPDPSFKPNIGDTVAVLKDGAYVRGVIINNLNKQFSCALIDYGVIESVNEVRPLPEKYMNIPEFACLFTADHDTIQEISNGTQHLMKIDAPWRITVTMQSSGKVFEIVGCRWDPFKTSTLAIQQTKPIQKPVEKQQKVYKIPPKKYQLQPKDKVIIESEVEESLVVRTRECNIKLLKINEELQNYQGESFTKQPEVNQLVVCPFVDGNMYRAVILSINDQNALVEYIDYGNSHTVPLKELKTIDEKLANIDSTAIKISLQGFVGGKFSSNALVFLEQCAVKREKFSVVAGNGSNVYDLTFRDDSSLSEKLKDLDVPAASTSAVKPPAAAVNPTHAAVMPTLSADKIITITDIPQCKFNRGNNEVLCLYAQDIEEGTVSLCPADPEKIANLMVELAEKIIAQVEEDTTPYHPKELEVCLAKYEGDWYRAAFIKQIENCYGMFYLDYGNTGTVTAEDIRKMPKDIAEIECLSALCVLQGVKQEDGTIKQPLLSKLKTAITENDVYSINVLKEEKNCYYVTIPSLFDEWKREGLL